MALLIAGAVLGVLGTLGILMAVVQRADARWVTRVEYDATLAGIQGQLADIKTDVRAMRTEGRRC